jgi:DNA-binding Lrp family transcriptional regulator
VDALDRQILAELQADGRLTVTELANRVGLSVSPCHRRLRDLEREGVITGYRALVDPVALGLGFEVVVLITMRRVDSPTVEEFERLLAQIRNVTSAQRLFGEPDYVLHVFCADIADYQRLWDEQLGTLPGVARFNSMMVMKQIVADRPPPVTPASSA